MITNNLNSSNTEIDCVASSAVRTPSTSNLRQIPGFGFEKPNAGTTNNWLTPPTLLERLGTFDLDPCGCSQMQWSLAATTYFLPEHDGLIEPWFGRVFCNPPYATRMIGPWLKRMAEHGNGMLLIYARCETQAWQRDVFPNADAVLFLEGRVHFCLPTGRRGESGTAPSMLLAYGQSNVDALRNAGIAGAFYHKAQMLSGIKASRF